MSSVGGNGASTGGNNLRRHAVKSRRSVGEIEPGDLASRGDQYAKRLMCQASSRFWPPKGHW
jgi:hypothetical protein